ncbi:flotillin domain-containing protein [Nitratireductor sp. XY-223]|uniref:flotillin domain-containing protein n=1 Tax=Nitratireductor sp. XY-223 TaxID=2561926 RepID=UPI0010AA795C|nr:flotillin domain-containing protein [Nitratireductor sp. XY-223]
MAWIISLLIFAIAVAVVIWFLHRYFAKATRELSLVRTGLGGQKTVIDGGCLALPILHQIQKVSMGAITVRLDRSGQHSLLTGDRLRADAEMEIEVRVQPTRDGVARAAQALGSRIARGGEAVEELLHGQLAAAMQDAAAARSLDDIHREREAFSEQVAQVVERRIEALGLTLVSAVLLRVDQGSFAGLDENNAFNSEGMRKLAGLVADNRKERVRIETEADIAVRESQLAQAQRRLDIERAEREAEIAQREHLSRLQAEAEAKSAEIRTEADRTSEKATLVKQLEIDAVKIANDEELRRKEMAAILTLEETKIENAMRLAQKRADEAEAKAAEEASRSKVLLAAESVQTDKETAVAKREKAIAMMKVDREISVEDARSKSDNETMLAKASADAKAAEIAAKAEKLRLESEADGQAALIAAENGLSEAIISMRLEERRLDRMPDIMTQMMKPVEKIDSIKINQIGGVAQGGFADGEGINGAFGAAMDQILGMAVRLPAMKQMGEEIGIDFDANLAGRTADYANRIRSKSNEKGETGGKK